MVENMKTLRMTIKPLTAFATPPHGDTLFGQLCWALRNRHGDTWLTERLQGYTQGNPFLVVSDLFPAEYWPRPHLPPGLFARQQDGQDRKAEKKKIWLPRQEWEKPLAAWVECCCTEISVWSPPDKPPWPAPDQPAKGRTRRAQPHNAINRLTGTTGKDGFAPYGVEQIWWPAQARLEAWLLHDPERLPKDALEAAMQDIGRTGFGKDASTGLGKFAVEAMDEEALPCQEQNNAWLTLGFCAPQGCGFSVAKSYYQLFTRFGRHGDTAAITGQPFKSPILLAQAGAVFTPSETSGAQRPLARRLFVGQGLGGAGQLSQAMAETVHQGYAPVVGIRVAWGEKDNG